jgi:hypothetical protein
VADSVGGSEYSCGIFYFGWSRASANIFLKTTAKIDNINGLLVLSTGQGTSYTNYYHTSGYASNDLDVAFYINNIHYKEADQQTYCGTNYAFKAEANIPISTDPTYPRWYFNDVENSAGREQMEWSTTLSPDTYIIKLEVKNAAGTVLEYLSTITVSGVPVIGAISQPEVCSGDTLNLAPPTVTAGGSAVTSQEWQLETGVESGTYMDIAMPYQVSVIDSGKKLRYSATNACGIAYSNEVTVSVYYCPSLKGTVFPFVHYVEPPFNKMFPTVAKLVKVTPDLQDFDDFLSATPAHIDTAVYYNGSIFVPNTPKYPGYIGVVRNPGALITWEDLGWTASEHNNELLLENELPNPSVGLFQFNKVIYGKYALILERAGYVTRIAIISVNDIDQFLEHRELIAGDVNGDFKVDEADILEILSKFSSYDEVLYDIKYDLNADLKIDMSDVVIARAYLRFIKELYKDTKESFPETK